MLTHLQRLDIELTEVVIHSDNGSEFDGTAQHKRDRGFVHSIETLFGATHRFIPPGCKNANADVDSIHPLWYNIARKNSSRDWKSPLDLLEQKAPELDVRILLLHSVALGRLWLSQPSRHPPLAHHLPVHPAKILKLNLSPP